MECTVVYRCECNNKTYPSHQSLKNHKKTKLHKSWMETKELRDLKIELTNRENVILSLYSKIDLLKELNDTLLKRLTLETNSPR